MKKILHIFKVAISLILNIIIAILMGLGSSLGKKPIEVEKKDNKTIGANK